MCRTMISMMLLRTVTAWVLTFQGLTLTGWGQAETRLPSVSYVSFADAGVEASPEMGVLRFRMEPFPYQPDTMSVSSHSKLGSLSAYVVRIYPPGRLVDWKKSLKDQQDLKAAGVNHGRVNNYYSQDKGLNGFFVEKGAKQAMVLQTYLRDSLPSGRPAEFSIVTKNLPPFVDIPVPEGTYYIEYSLKFDNNNLSKPPNVHPNYPSKSPSQKASLEWGPPRVTAKAGRVADIRVAPSTNINFYDYPMENWENSDAQWDYVEYLIWAGEM